MSARRRQEVLEQARQWYAGRGRKGRTRLRNEVCQLTGYESHYAIKVLRGKRPIGGQGTAPRGGSGPQYGEAERAVIKAIWLASEQPCGKRLKAALPLWLPFFEQCEGRGSTGAGEGSARQCSHAGPSTGLPSPNAGLSGTLRHPPGDSLAQPDLHSHRALGCGRDIWRPTQWPAAGSPWRESSTGALP